MGHFIYLKWLVEEADNVNDVNNVKLGYQFTDEALDLAIYSGRQQKFTPTTLNSGLFSSIMSPKHVVCSPARSEKY